MLPYNIHVQLYGSGLNSMELDIDSKKIVTAILTGQLSKYGYLLAPMDALEDDRTLFTSAIVKSRRSARSTAGNILRSKIFRGGFYSSFA